MKHMEIRVVLIICWEVKEIFGWSHLLIAQDESTCATGARERALRLALPLPATMRTILPTPMFAPVQRLLHSKVMLVRSGWAQKTRAHRDAQLPHSSLVLRRPHAGGAFLATNTLLLQRILAAPNLKTSSCHLHTHKDNC